MSEVEPRPVAYGANCGVGRRRGARGAAEHEGLRRALDDVLVAKSNCGIPQVDGGEVRYSGTPELMSDYVHMALDAGARIVGGCMRNDAGPPPGDEKRDGLPHSAESAPIWRRSSPGSARFRRVLRSKRANCDLSHRTQVVEAHLTYVVTENCIKCKYLHSQG